MLTLSAQKLRRAKERGTRAEKDLITWVPVTAGLSGRRRGEVLQAWREWSLLCWEDLSPAPCRAQEGEGAKLNGGPMLSDRCLCYHKGKSVWGGHLQKPHSPAIWEVASLPHSCQACQPGNISRGAGADSSDVNSWFTHMTWSHEETEARGRQQLSGTSCSYS